MMYKQMKILIRENNKFYNYMLNGYKFELDYKTCRLIITYKNKQYVVTIICENGKFCWQLIPYNRKKFVTSINNSLEMVLLAIKENDELYS